MGQVRGQAGAVQGVTEIDQQDRQDDDQGCGSLADELDRDELRASGEDEERQPLNFRRTEPGLDAQRAEDEAEGEYPDQDRGARHGLP